MKWLIPCIIVLHLICKQVWIGSKESDCFEINYTHLCKIGSQFSSVVCTHCTFNFQQGGPGMYQGGPGIFGAAPPMPPQQLEVTYLYIPESTVGAVIGTSGVNIKSIMRLSNARIKVSGCFASVAIKRK